MDAFNDPLVRRVVVMSSAQVAKTTILENVTGYFVQHDPSPIMLVFPTIEIAEAFSRDRLAPMIRDTPALRERFPEARSRQSDNALLHKAFPGGHLTIAGANSENSLSSRPIRIVLGDEAAKWKPNSGGSPFPQVAARTERFWNAKEGYFTTPTTASHEFIDLWNESDKRLFDVPCPQCRERIVFAFDETADSLPINPSFEVLRAVLKFVEGQRTRNDDGRDVRRAADAWFQCLVCGCRIDDVERMRTVRGGEWNATEDFHGTAGFWVWEAYAPFSSALKIANNWLGALGGGSTQLQAAKNLKLGLPWKQKGDAPEWKRLFDRAVSSPRRAGDTIPREVLFLTGGVDVQKDWVEGYFYGWGRGLRCWLIDHFRVDGDVRRPELWADVDKFLGAVYRHQGGTDMPLRKVGVDSGYEADAVYAWARRRQFGLVEVVKGGPDSMTAIVAQPSPVETTVFGKKLPTGVKVVLINVSHFKRELYGRLSLETPNTEKGESYPDGWIDLCPTNDTEEYCRQLTAEQIVRGENRRHYDVEEFRKIRPRNEALDCWNIARAMAYRLGMDRYREQDWAALERQLGMAAELPAPAFVPAIQQQAPAPPSVPPVIQRGRRVFRSSYMG